MKRFLVQAAALVLLLAYFAQGMVQIRSASITFDEGPHLAIGYATLQTGDFRLQPVHIHPPLANVLAALPLALQQDLPDPRDVSGWEISSLSAITDAVVWRYPYPARLATAGRLPILWLGVLLGALVFRWARMHGKLHAGLLALSLYAFDPNMVTHGAWITTDIAAVLLMTAALYAVECYKRTGTPRMLVVTGVLLGLAQLAKVSALMLIPVVGFLLFLNILQFDLQAPSFKLSRRQVRSLILQWITVFSISAFVVWAGYQFEVIPVEGIPFPVPAGTHLRIYQSLQEHYELGHPTFLLGRNSTHGWWWYFPVAFALKTPLPLLILLVWASLTRIRAILRRPSAALSAILAHAELVLFPVLYTLTSLLSTVDIGYRHLLPILPFIYIGIGVTLTRKANLDLATLKSRTSLPTPHAPTLTQKAVLTGLVLWQAVGTLAIAPHYLTFFNEVAGGPTQGYRVLVDSNLDWGQNLWDLKAWMEAHGESHVYYAHYSPARPETYGINATFLPPDPRAEALAPWAPKAGLYAIGATVLQGPYAPDINTYAWFRTHEPVARLGNALFLYKVVEQPDAAWAAVCADPAPLVSAERAAAYLGTETLRVITLNCRQSQIYPQGTGVVILPPDVSPPPATALDVRTRTAEGTALYDVYRSQGRAWDITDLPGSEPLEAHPQDGPLRFVGYQISQTAPQPGNTLHLKTIWEVTAVPTRAFSLMAHLVKENSVPIAVGDGLGIPFDQLQPGDVIVQDHALALLPETPSGRYRLQTGGYWLDSMERWLWDTASGPSDRILLPEIEVIAPAP
ncbi:MAG: glycosyltransferase family 39 protein [Anaerolineae bacterium]|jgi:hypothetical protein|nr:glycosyltransferase family 39 protein [Anaerolineae bacterium]